MSANSKVQLEIEAELRAKMSQKLNMNFVNTPVTAGGQRYEFDGICEASKVVMEVTARIGSASASRRHKIAFSAAKMASFAKLRGETWRFIIVLASEQFHKGISSGLIAQILKHSGVEVMVLKLEKESEDRLLGAQRLQAVSNHQRAA